MNQAHITSLTRIMELLISLIIWFLSLTLSIHWLLIKKSQSGSTSMDLATCPWMLTETMVSVVLLFFLMFFLFVFTDQEAYKGRSWSWRWDFHGGGSSSRLKCPSCWSSHRVCITFTLPIYSFAQRERFLICLLSFFSTSGGLVRLV